MLADELCVRVRVRARTHVKSHMQKGICNKTVWKLILQPRQMCTGVLSEETSQRAPTREEPCPYPHLSSNVVPVLHCVD